MDEMISDFELNTELPECGDLPTSTQSAEDVTIDPPEAFEELTEEDVREPTVFTDATSNEAAEVAPNDENPAFRESALLEEISRLKDELARRDSMAERIAREGEEFRTLYPKARIEEIPDSVWKDVGEGIPLAAAYALFERRRFYTEQKAAEYNQANKHRSSGSLEPTEPDYYSPAEVRAMSQNEVRANYDKIMRSMQKWH